jgi:hypothetical protein
MGQFIKTLFSLAFLGGILVAIFFTMQYTKFTSGDIDYTQPLDITLNHEYISAYTYNWKLYNVGDINLKYPPQWTIKTDPDNPKAVTFIKNTDEDLPAQIFVQPLIAGGCTEYTQIQKDLYSGKAQTIKESSILMDGDQAKIIYAFTFKQPYSTKNFFICIPKTFSDYAVVLSETTNEVRVVNFKTLVTMLNSISEIGQ